MLMLLLGLAFAPIQTVPEPTLFDGVFCGAVSEEVEARYRASAASGGDPRDVAIADMAKELAGLADAWTAAHVERHPPTEAELDSLEEATLSRADLIDAGGLPALVEELQRCDVLFFR